MDLGLFLLGMLGALLTVYLAKEEAIPEFRALFDTSEKAKEAREHQTHIKKTEKDIDAIQHRIRTEPLAEDAMTRLTVVLESSEVELEGERTRLQMLEREVKQGQVISRGLGFLFYIVLGGVFGSLLAGRVQVEGLSGDLPNFFESIVIGATWSTYLSVIGFSQVRKKVDEKLEAVKMEILETAAGQAKRTGQPLPADEVAAICTEKLDLARMDVRQDLKGG